MNHGGSTRPYHFVAQKYKINTMPWATYAKNRTFANVIRTACKNTSVRNTHYYIYKEKGGSTFHPTYIFAP